MAELRTAYIPTDDGQQLYAQDVGDGPTILCCNGAGVSTFFWAYLQDHFRKRFRVVLWDYRGHGRSSTPADPETADLSIPRFASDLRAVIQRLDVDEPPILIGHSMGCQVILEYAARHPGEVRALVPMLGTYARPLDTLLDSPLSRPIFDLVKKTSAAMGRGGRRWFRPLVGAPWAFDVARRAGLVDRHYANRQDLEMYLEHLNKMDPRVLFRTIEQIADHDLTDALPGITAPTLVVAAENDLFTPLRCSEDMARLLPHAELFVLAQGSHAALVEHPETINLRLERFFDEVLDLDPSADRPDDPLG
jgi:pimeloyl-ACP methyl ester carboxylesterase